MKKSGYIFQRDGEHFTVRLRVPGGELSSEQLMAVGKIAREWGRGEVHLTTRQGIEIPWIRFEHLGEVTKALEMVGTPPGSCGPRVRNISSCVGLPRCPHANIDSRGLAERIDELFFDAVLPTKLKIAISGCPNSCAKPQVNDIGVLGVVRPRIIPDRCDGCGICVRICREAAIRMVNGKAEIDFARCVHCGECIRAGPAGAGVADREGYTIFVGGNVGRHPRLAHKLLDFADDETLFRVVENSIRLFKAEGERRERFGHLIERIGLGESIRRLLS
ncbi:MAG: 4Fe-4S binding protein [Candidatus Bathyarchaeia archaeon]